MLPQWLLLSAVLTFVAAPGEALPTIEEAPKLAREAVARRLQGEPQAFHISRVNPSRRTPGFVVCGTFDSHATSERFFVVIPGDFAILEHDDPSLLSTYWAMNQC